MSTATLAPRVHRSTSYRLTVLHAVSSEWIKLATLRSTWWSIGITGILTIGIAALIAQSMNAPGFDGIQAVVSPIQFTMLLAGVLGAISVTGEYSTGMIRSTLAAVPVRGLVLAAKAGVVALLLLVSSFVIFLLAALAVMPILDAKGAGLDWADPERTVLPIIAASVSMAVFSLIGVAFGFLLRSGAGAIAATVGLLFILPIIMSIFAMPGAGWEWITDITAHLPMLAAQSAILPQEAGISAGEAYATLGAWVAGGLLAAWAVLRTRDA